MIKKLFLITSFGFGLSSMAQFDTCSIAANFTYSLDGANINLTNTSTGGSGLANYSWTVDGLSSNLENPSFSTSSFEASELICLTISDSAIAECSNTYCTTIYFDEDTTGTDTTVFCDLNADFTYSTDGTTLTLTNTSTGSSLVNYNWTVDGLSSGLENPSFSSSGFEASELVCLTISDSAIAGCSDNYCTTIYFEEDSTGTDTTVFCDLSADFTYSVDGSNINFTNTSTGTADLINYSWTIDGLSSSLENPSFPTSGFEASELVCLTISDSGFVGCSDSYCTTIYFDGDTTGTDTTVTDSTASIETIEKLMVKVYPNPATTTINLEISSDLGQNQIMIINTLGEMVRFENAITNNTTVTIDIADLPNGFYFINIINEVDTSLTRQYKFVKK